MGKTLDYRVFSHKNLVTKLQENSSIIKYVTRGLNPNDGMLGTITAALPFYAKRVEDNDRFDRELRGAGTHINAADLSIIPKDLDALEASMEIFDRTIAINLRGHLLCTRHALPELLKRGGGAIVYTTSGAAFAGEPTRVSYAVSKSGLHALMRHVASRWGKEGIRANAVPPGFVLSETALASTNEKALAAQLVGVRSPRHGKPSDIAAAVAYLMSADAEWVNGQVMVVTGAGRGVDRGIATVLAGAGAIVICSARSRSEIDDTAAAISSVRRLPKRSARRPTRGAPNHRRHRDRGDQLRHGRTIEQGARLSGKSIGNASQ